MRSPVRVLVVLATLSFIPTESFLLPLLFPFTVKITLRTERRPPVLQVYKYEKAPVYKEVIVKPHSHPYKESYGDGFNKGSSYGDGHHKVYVQEQHVKGYTHPYDTTSSPYDEVQYHYKGSSHTTPTDYVSHDKAKGYPSPSSHVATPGDSYEDYASAYKSSRYPPAAHKATTKAYIASGKSHDKPHQYASYEDEHAPTYIDDTLPTGHSYHPPQHYAEEQHYEAEFQPLQYAGFGSAFYGDSYAKIVYTPPRVQLKLSLQTYKKK